MMQTVKKLFFGWAILLSYAGVALFQTIYQAIQKVVG